MLPTFIDRTDQRKVDNAMYMSIEPIWLVLEKLQCHLGAVAEWLNTTLLVRESQLKPGSPPTQPGQFFTDSVP